MRAVLQRVRSAAVHGALALTVNGEQVSSIGPGILALIGMCTEDTPEHADWVITKMTSLKLWPEGASVTVHPDEARPWRTNVRELGGEILCVSQFTLYAKTAKGSKPDFHRAMGGAGAEPFYREFLDKLRAAHDAEKVKDGKFGAMMDVSLVNDGPVTIRE